MKDAFVPLTRRAVFRALGVAAAAVAGVLFADHHAFAQARTKMVIGTSADLVAFNPLVGNSRTDTWVTQLMYPRLMQITLEGRKEPQLATKWGYDSGGTTARMTIRDDFRWSDGGRSPPRM
jgi:peptide/nickel transport system substrate-binding protein